MAKFNPDIPTTEAPSYLGYSKPIEQPQANVTLGTAIKGLGEVGGLAVKGADEAVKAKLSDAIYAKADTNRQIYTADLESARGAGSALNIIPPGGQAAAEGDNVPTEVTIGADRATHLATARANGKISSTYYWGKMNELAKSLRAQYPGYRDYIDQQFSSITGQNPSNAYVSSLVQDLNAQAAGANTGMKALMTEFRSVIGDPGDPKTGVPAANIAMGMVQRGEKTEEWGWAFIARSKRQQWESAQSTAQSNVYSNNKVFLKGQAENDFTGRINVGITNYLDTLKLPTGDKATEWINKVQRGEIQVPDEQAQAVGQFLLGHYQTLYAQMKTQLYTPDGITDPTTGAKTTPAARMGGPEAANKFLDAQMAAFKQIIEDTSNNKLGAAYIGKNFVEAKVNSVKAAMVSDKDTGRFFSDMAAVNSLGGPQVSKDFQTTLMGNTNVAEKLLQRYQADSYSLGVQTNPLTGLPTLPHEAPTTTFDQTLRAGAAVGIGDPKRGSSAEEAGGYNQAILQRVNQIVNPKNSDAIKINHARAAFSPENREMLNNFVLNAQSPDEGYYGAFKTFTSPAITKEMWRLSADHPELWKNYTDTINTWFGRTLLRNEVQQLNEIAADPRIRVGWNKETGQFTEPQIVPGADPRLPPPSRMGYYTAVNATQRLNGAMRNIKKVADQEGTDINAYVVQRFVDNGVNIGNLPTSMVGAAIKAILVANQPPPTAAPAPEKKSNYTDEQFGPISRTLKDWLKAPVPEPKKEEAPSKDQSRVGDGVKKVKTESFRKPEVGDNYAGSR